MADFGGFFATSRTQAVPTLAEAAKSLHELSSGCSLRQAEFERWKAIRRAS